MPSSSSTLFSCLILLTISSIANAVVPAENQFQFTINPEFGDYIVEYNGNYVTTSIFNSPFQLMFYNTTPNAFTLALRMGLVRSESLFRWVWEANRGNPVGLNATLTLGANGNLVLADADGRVAWQTNTTNKGVQGLSLLPNGNMVLYNSNGSFVWQSFDYPTDTILAGQSLKASSPNKLVSRASESENKNGPYSLVLEKNALVLYYQSSNSAAKKYTYYSYARRFFVNNGALDTVTFKVEPDTDENFAYNLIFDYTVKNQTIGSNAILARPKYNATLSFLRLGIDGNVKIYTYFDKVDYGAWEETYTLFDRDSESECQLPERCGNFGLCENNQCVACPLETGLMGWSSSCEAETVSSAACSKKAFHYYKVEGVDNFMSTYTKGDVATESGCGSKCSSDCKCLGYFYRQKESRCWLAYDLMTLSRVANSTHVGYIKVPNQ